MSSWWRSKLTGPVAFWVDAFVVLNLAFLALDVWVAHASNQFARPIEWLPVALSSVAPLLLAPALFSARYYERSRAVALTVGGSSIFVGLLGMVLHLQSAFFVTQTLHNLVYTAPFVAPLAYTGIGFLIVLNRLEATGSVVWSQWVLLLTLGGFVGNLALALLDHAQNGFFYPSEWVGVVASAFAVSTLMLMVLHPADVVLRRFAAYLLALQALVGIAGFVLHLLADLRRAEVTTLQESLIYGAPLFAPLLFTNLSLLGGLGLWALERAPGTRASA